MRIRGREVPLPFLLALGAVATLALILAVTGSGLVGIESLYFFLLGNTVATVTTMALAALGGAFVGLVVGHYIFAAQSFTPFERRVIETLDDVEEMAARLDDLEDRLAEDVDDLREDVQALREDLEGDAPEAPEREA